LVYDLTTNLAHATPLIESAIEKAKGHPVHKTMDECDANWRSILSRLDFGHIGDLAGVADDLRADLDHLLF
jgi:hypothetical protein